MFESINPATGELIRRYEEMSRSEARAIVKAVHQAYSAWRDSNLAVRVTQLLKLQALLLERKEEFARMITREMGKPISAARAEVDKCIQLCEYCSTHAEQALAPREVQTHHQKSYVSYEPIGVIFSIMPWNFPLWQALRSLLPVLMAGNAVVLSHAKISTATALMLEKLVYDAGYPEHLFRVLIIDRQVAAEIIAESYVRGVTLTGSEQAGKSIAKTAANHLKKVTLELGGSDPYVILDDADIELAADICVNSRLNNAGQVCIAAKRLICLPEVRQAFQAAVIEKAQAYQMGDPMDEHCNFGPMARKDLRATLHRQVQACIAQGAELVCGGEIPQGPGFYYPVTILKHVKPGMPAYEDELFGPVIAFIDAEDESDACEIANSVRFALGAAVFSRDVKRGEHIARYKLHAGTCCVNTAVASHPALPFGGLKASGYGRELGVEGIREFTNIKVICVQ